MRIQKNRKAGFTLVEIMIVVAIIGLLAAIAIPNFVKARESAQTNACINNLRQIDGAMEQWALENNATTTTSVDISDLYGAGKFIKAEPICPADSAKSAATSYTVSAIGTAPVCQIAATTHKLPNS